MATNPLLRPPAGTLVPLEALGLRNDLEVRRVLDVPNKGERMLIVTAFDGTEYVFTGGVDDGAPAFDVHAASLDEALYTLLGLHEQHKGERFRRPKLTEKDYQDGLKAVMEEKVRMAKRQSTFGYGGSLTRTD